MKFLSALVLILAVFSGCQKDNPVVPQNTEKGNITFKIDRENAPENVIFVTATLSRTGYQNISSSMNLLSDTTAELTLNDIPSGPWHLKVEAFDSSNVAVYSGETDVTILANITVQVNLTLMPTGNGYGNIYIYVTWGVPSTWVDYINNPILTASQTNAVYVAHPFLLFDNNIYKMWYIGVYPSAYSNTWYAESNDGFTWNTIGNQPVLSPTPYSWDSQECSSGPVIKEGSLFKMYYTGGSGSNEPWHIGLAVSPDGINWEKHPTPVLYASSFEYQIVANSLVKKNDKYYLYYTIRNNDRSIGLATSFDGINWTKSQYNPILENTQIWEGTGVMYSSVILENDIFKMIYQNYNETGFGEATSIDGINWTKNNNNPIFKPSDTHNNWCYQIAYPFYAKYGNQYRIYYTGTYSNGLAIGVVRKN